MATLAGQKPVMTMGRFFFLCLLSVTIAVAGPVARGVAAQAAPLLPTVESSGSGVMSPPKAGVTFSSRCQRGAAAWQACAFDPGPAPVRADFAAADTAKIFDPSLHGTAGELLRSRLFRPPRKG